MSGHLNDEQIESYLKRELSGEDRAQIDSHLNDCVDCRDRLHREERVQAGTTSLLQSLQSEAQEPQEHLSFEQLEAWADDRLDPVDREIVDSHLEICPLCRFEADDLRVYRTILTTYPEKEYAPSSSPSWIHQKLFAFLHSPSRITKWHLAAVLCLCALLFWAASRPLLNRMNDFQSQATMMLELKNPQPDPNPHPSQPAAPDRVSDSTVSYPLILKDGGRMVVLNAQGELTGFEGLPEAYQAVIREAMKSGQLPSPARDLRYGRANVYERMFRDRIIQRAQGSLVAESVLLMKYGFITEALASLQKLAEENPQSLLVERWRQNAHRRGYL